MTEKDLIRSCMFEYEIEHDFFNFEEFLKEFPELSRIKNLLCKMKVINNGYNKTKKSYNFYKNLVGLLK